jgi:hypothetical protein
MKHVLILGANGQVARNTTRVFLHDSDAKLTLYLRRSNRLENPDPSRVTIVEGDGPRPAMKGQDVVYASLAGDMKRQAEHIIDAMHSTGVKRLISSARWASTARFPESGTAASSIGTAIRPPSSRRRTSTSPS